MDNIVNIIYTKIHHIDADGAGSIIEKQISEEDAQAYIKNILSDMLIIKNIRMCEAEKGSHVVMDIEKIYNIYNEAAVTGDHRGMFSIDSTSKNIAERLLRAEKKAKKLEANLKMTVTKGSLVQALVETEIGYGFILAKIEHEPYIDTEQMKKRYGFPYKQITLKSCVIDLDENFVITKIRVSDTGSTIAKYWREDFLDITPTINNTDNTRKIYSAIYKVLNRNIREKSIFDFEVLKQKVDYYFSSNEEYKHSELISYVVDNFSPDVKLQIDKEKVISELNDIPNKYSVDTQFSIDYKAIQKKVNRSIDISDGIQISFQVSPEELERKIKSKIEDGIKTLKIIGVNEEVYNRFKE